MSNTDKEKNIQHYDVGITGYWWSTNYGSVATYYALYKVVEELGMKTVFLDRPESRENGEGMDVFSRFFMNEYAEVAESCYWHEVNQYNDLCDTFIIGSDQVWTATSIKGYGYFFFLDFADDDKNKIAYASSFGEVFNVDAEMTKKSSEYLKRFSNISVREFQAVDICREQLDVKAEWVMDPVFLLKRKFWDAIAEKAPRKTADILGKDQKYLLTYILNPSEEKRELVNEVAKKLGLPVICILDGRKGTFRENNKAFSMKNTIRNATEEEWLYFFENAEYIVTDSQHGSAFSIIFNKQFICCSNKKWGQARYESLFGLLGLKDRQKLTWKDADEAKIYNKKIDYNRVNAILEKRVRLSYEWLQNALGINIQAVNQNTVTKIADENKCTGCGGCAAVCPENAITMTKNRQGFFIPEVNGGKCTLCGKCLETCISENPVYQNDPSPECYAVMADDQTRNASSSGGMFSLAAEYIIDKGGYVCGAAFTDDFSVEHIIISNKENIPKLRGAKYIQSNVKNIYSDIKTLLENGNTVLFTGVPCQIAALNAYLGKPYDNLYTMDIVCGGITSQKVFDKYHQDILGGKKITELNFSDKKKFGWNSCVSAVFEDGTKYSASKQSDPYAAAFTHSLSKNIACAKCKANALPRQSDMTTGDFWGISLTDTSMNDKKGTSIVLVNSPKGAALFEELKPFMKKQKAEPIDHALQNNRALSKPCILHKNHRKFFENLDQLDFGSLTKGCLSDRLYDEQKKILLRSVSENDLDLYYIAKTVYEKSHGRKIVTLGKSPDFERVLKKYFALSVSFSVARNIDRVDDQTVFPFKKIADRPFEYYLVSAESRYSSESYDAVINSGYTELEDFIFIKHAPIVLTNISLSKGGYSDRYGNSIEGASGVISEVIFRGENSHIIIGDSVKHTENLRFDMTSNVYIRIGKGCSFNDSTTQIETKGFKGSGRIIIGESCKFGSSRLLLFTGQRKTQIIINESCTFGNGLELHANTGKKVIIGRDCMLSKDINICAGDGHSIFDVNTEKNISSSYSKTEHHRSQIVIGEHVWIANGVFIQHGTDIGSGSIIGANTVLEDIFPNNCSVVGNPARIIKKDVAWSRDMSANNPQKVGRKEYFLPTSESSPALSGRNVLVIGDIRTIEKPLIKKLLTLGNTVTVANKGLSADDFGIDITRLTMDPASPKSTKKALAGRHFDVIFDNTALCSNYTDNILSNVSCDRYVQISSIQTYRELSMNMQENQFVPENTELVMCNRRDVDYVEGRRQAEAVLYQKYNQISAVSVRLPYIMPNPSLAVYCDNIIQDIPLNITDPDRAMTFAKDTDTANFLVWLANQEITGPVNFAGSGFVTVSDIIGYIENKLHKKAVILNDSLLPPEPFFKFRESSYSLDLGKIISAGYQPAELKSWFYQTLDDYIRRSLKK